ncbi:acyltransferase family protein [Vibrio lentus]|uniref:acyltransferase family protein n=1 Tax=Vibrio lentus TaxID=136468 RepID=UPI000C81EFE0|nr:acyltransferase [Vibrio lentus]PMJ07721.1 hypothetical protein BCU30_08825 [Vibrio lentus]PMN68835.1 hypothetical protein BCT26_08355 [Vibrio lentus]
MPSSINNVRMHAFTLATDTGDFLKNRRIVFLDYLRVFAFITVVVAHKFYNMLEQAIVGSQLPSYLNYISLTILSAFQGGGTGVIVFFLVSGYIITFVLNNESSSVFFIKRFFRIYPLYIFAVSLQYIHDYYSFGVIPDAEILIPQLFLIGDFFNAPHTLWGVEWTLRVEVMFYIYMGILKKVNIFDNLTSRLPYIYLVTSAVIGLTSPFPSGEGWSQGIFSIYSPMLFIGSMIFLYERNIIKLYLVLFPTSLILGIHYYLMYSYSPDWFYSHFSLIALTIFITTWWYRESLNVTSTVLLLSNLTYSVYLFHNWPWDSIKSFYDQYSINIIHPDLQALISILAFSYITLQVVEKPFIKLGNRLTQFGRKPTA